MALTRRVWLDVLGAALMTVVVSTLGLGIPTAVIPSPWFGRAVPVRPLDYAFLALMVLLAAALGATCALPVACPTGERRLTAGGMRSFFAIGCPVCNKIGLLVLGWGGALTSFAPLQPFLGVAALALLGTTLATRLRAIRRALHPVPPLAPATFNPQP